MATTILFRLVYQKCRHGPTSAAPRKVKTPALPVASLARGVLEHELREEVAGGVEDADVTHLVSRGSSPKSSGRAPDSPPDPDGAGVAASAPPPPPPDPPIRRRRLPRRLERCPFAAAGRMARRCRQGGSTDARARRDRSRRRRPRGSVADAVHGAPHRRVVVDGASSGPRASRDDHRGPPAGTNRGCDPRRRGARRDRPHRPGWIPRAETRPVSAVGAGTLTSSKDPRVVRARVRRARVLNQTSFKTAVQTPTRSVGRPNARSERA